MLNLKTRLSAICLLVLMVALGCSGNAAPLAESPADPTPAPDNSAETEPVLGIASVEIIELVMQESFPVQISAVARGQLPDDCTTISSVDQAKNGYAYNVAVSTLQDTSRDCSPAPQPFEETIVLDVLDIPAGTYLVNVNGVQQAFVLSADNSALPEPTAAIPTPEPTPEPEPTAEPAVEPTAEPEAAETSAEAAAEGSEEAVAVEAEAEAVAEPAEEEAEVVTEEGAESADVVDSAETSTTEEASTVIFNDPSCIDLVLFDRDVSVLDDTPMQPGDAFTKIWRVINTGSCAWDSTYSIRFTDGDQMSAPDEIFLDRVVQTGDSFDISVPMIAPDELGVYRGDFLLHSPEGEPMGLDGKASETVWLQIEVVEPNSLGEVSGRIWEDACNQADYTYGVSTSLPKGCVENTNGTVRGDGVYDAENEAVIPNAIVSLLSGECGTAEDLYNTVTDENGMYRFFSLTPGTYCIYLDVLETGNFEIFIPGTTSFPLPGKTSSTVTIEGGSNFDSISFGWDRTEE